MCLCAWQSIKYTIEIWQMFGFQFKCKSNDLCNAYSWVKYKFSNWTSVHAHLSASYCLWHLILVENYEFVCVTMSILYSFPRIMRCIVRCFCVAAALFAFMSHCNEGWLRSFSSQNHQQMHSFKQRNTATLDAWRYRMNYRSCHGTLTQQLPLIHACAHDVRVKKAWANNNWLEREKKN